MKYITTVHDRISQLTLLPDVEQQDNFDNEIKLFFNKAILSGEYYEPAALTQLEAIKIKLQTLQVTIQAITDTPAISLATPIESQQNLSDLDIAEQKAKQSKASAFIQSISALDVIYVKKILDLVKSVDNNLKYIAANEAGVKNDSIAFRTRRIRDEYANIYAEKDFDALFDINIELCYWDEYLEGNLDMHRRLKDIRHALQEFTAINQFNREIIELLKAKVGLIEYKVAFRLYKDGELVNPPQKPRFQQFNDFLDKLSIHYTDFRKPEELKYFEAKVFEWESYFGEESGLFLKDKNADIFKLEYFHHLIRYYHRSPDKDLSPEIRIRKLEGLRSCFKKHYNVKSEGLFNEIAFRSCQNLLFNALLDLRLLKERKTNFKQVLEDLNLSVSQDDNQITCAYIESLLSELHSFAQENRFFDYHGYKLLIDFFDKILDYLAKSPEKLIITSSSKYSESERKKFQTKYQNILIYIELVYRETLLKLKKNLNKMRTHEVKALSLAKNECLVGYKWQDSGEEGVLFLDSSYVLPINYDKLLNFIKSSETNLTAMLNNQKNRFEMELGMLYINDSKAAFESKVKENEFKVVQIVAMFVSIATFVLINVKIFDKRNAQESFGIMLGLAVSFFLFNSFFYFIIIASAGTKITSRQIRAIVLFLTVPMIFLLYSKSILKDADESRQTISKLNSKATADSVTIDSFKKQFVVDTVGRQPSQPDDDALRSE